jgi:hypothetical protein
MDGDAGIHVIVPDIQLHPTPSTPISAFEMYDWSGRVEVRLQLGEGPYRGRIADAVNVSGRSREGGLDSG